MRDAFSFRNAGGTYGRTHLGHRHGPHGKNNAFTAQSIPKYGAIGAIGFASEHQELRSLPAEIQRSKSISMCDG